ncbi:TPM domain-containing protein [Treponema sp. OMZ 857]|uniref:TPM domain-containing protein n=1 Tax=Treponema sp. OMZ 857 TaxID=1643513 RepID=UPI0020A4770D|nr:TPM domain-containing protein [Treponema sp. OMZ 857]UTC43812.1 TPM domain-containing protein [Treponema sp. OMZ 857]
MKKNRLLKLMDISPTQMREIANTVAEAEKKTTGEIALAVVYQSDSYAFVELFVAFCASFLSFLILFLCAAPIWNLLERTVWFPSPAQLTAVIGSGAATVVLIVYLLVNIPAIDRLIIPNTLKNRRVYARALQHFVESGVYKTTEHSGVLIFASVLERKFFVIADSGIAAKVAQNEWDGICKIMTTGLKEHQAAQAFVSAVKECGRILQQNFPSETENPNELPDGLIVLES